MRRSNVVITKKTGLIFAISLVIALSTYFLLAASLAKAAVIKQSSLSANTISGLNNSIVPDPSQFTKKDQVYMEISQTGAASSLNAPESWTKVYVDPTKFSSAVVGIFAGAYTGCGIDFSVAGTCLSGANDVNFELYAARDGQPDKNIPKYIDDSHCAAPFTTVHSAELSGSQWDAVRLSGYANTGCDGEPILATHKTGKIVIFVHAYWRTAGSNRTNAFKIGGGYLDSAASAKAGYWSQYDVATSPSPKGFDPAANNANTRGAYAVQDRVGANKSEQGNYSFSFGPDCYLKFNDPDPKIRYLKWYDVDLDFYNGLPAQPSFQLFDVKAGTVVPLTDVATGATYTTVSGSALGGKNIFRQMSFQGKGGHIYAWRWRNVVQRDGIVFWMPYDDFPSSVGCGTYNHKITLYGGVGGLSGTSTVDFTAPGNAMLNFLVDEQYSGGTAAAPRTTSHAYLANASSAVYSDAFDPPGAISISDNGNRNGRAQVDWELDGMGPASPYTSRRWLRFSYKTKNDAQQGAKYCFTASMSPKSSSSPTSTLTSNRICVTIDNSLRPFLTTSGGNVHAGQGDCVIPTETNQRIDGIPIGADATYGSSGSYVVSSGGPIANFGSGGAPDRSSLTMASYGAICRPGLDDLLRSLQAEDQQTVKPAPLPAGSTVDLSTVPVGQRTLIEINGDGYVRGQAKAPVTVLSRTGTITIQTDARRSDVGADTSFAASKDKLPVVGIAAQRIRVDAAVYRLNALLYAVGNIDTCAGHAAQDPTCHSVLLLKGFAMAHDFSFKRTSSGPSGYQLAEQIDFNAAFYLSPPPLFINVAGAVQYEGERSPLY